MLRSRFESNIQHSQISEPPRSKAIIFPSGEKRGVGVVRLRHFVSCVSAPSCESRKEKGA